MARVGSLKHLHHTATLLTTPSGHCRLDTGHRPDQTQTSSDIFCSRSLPSDCQKKCSCDKPPCLCSNGYALCVLRSIELKRERAILPVFANQFVDFALDFGRLISRAEPPVDSSKHQHPVLTMTIPMLAVWRQRGSAGVTDWLIEAVAASGQHRDCGRQQTCSPCVTLFSMVR